MTTLWHVAINYQSVLSDGFDFIIILLRTYGSTPFEWLGQKLYCILDMKQMTCIILLFLIMLFIWFWLYIRILGIQSNVTVYRLLNGLLRQDNTNCIQQKLYPKTIWNWRICTLISFWITYVSSLIFLQNLIKILLD